MHAYPHHYLVSASSDVEGEVTLTSEGVADLPSMPPVEFDGPGGYWSPESLLVASVADCLILTFRAVARASKLEWTSLSCDVDGALDRVERVTQFTGVSVRAELVVPEGTDVAKAERLLHKAEQGCLITNSLKAESNLDVTVRVAG